MMWEICANSVRVWLGKEVGVEEMALLVWVRLIGSSMSCLEGVGMGKGDGEV
jgi:hypothetical protein